MHRPDPQDDDAEGQEPGGIAVVRHRSEDDLKKGGDQQGRAAEQAGLEGAEGELRLEDRDLAGDDGHGAVVREVVDRVREEDSPGTGHGPAMLGGLIGLGLTYRDRRARGEWESPEDPCIDDNPSEER